MQAPLPPAFLSELEQILPDGGLLTDPADGLAYGYDNSRHRGRAQAVALPRDAQQIVALVRACRAARVPITARGRGTNTTGASVPIAGGVVVTFERMHRILRIDPDNRLAVVEPGVINGELQRALAPHGFFWPPDPTSADYATVAGNIACNAGGPRTLKYGATRENVLGLEAVTGAGALIRTGGATTKGATGYDLTRLLIGSEGTLALITEATLKLAPRPQATASVRALYHDVPAAARAVARVMAQPVIPCALEFMDPTTLRLARDGGVDLPAAGALLLVEVDGIASALRVQLDAVKRALQGEGLAAIHEAEDEASRAALWSARKALAPQLRKLAPGKINEDVVVPVSRLPDLVAGVERIAAERRIAIVSFGHAGNGNLHVNIMYHPDDARESASAHEALEELFGVVLELGGTLSGEHGIGIEKRDYVPRALDPGALEAMRGIKAVFDPDGILNPGKLLPAA
jgi:D-lactate dehydrogenase